MADREMTNEEAIEILGGIRACYNIFDEYDEPKYAALSKAIFALKAEPIKHGKWIEHQNGRWVYAKCSKCKTIHDVRSNYCPNCGARMDGEKERMTIQEAINGFEMDNALLAGSGETGVIERNILAIDALHKAADISEQLENAYAHGYTAAEAEFRKVMETDRWIPVKERLPEDDVSVLVSYIGLTRDKEQYKGVTIATYDSDFEGWYRDNDFAAIAAVVTAWQPLPEPYKGGEL